MQEWKRRTRGRSRAFVGADKLNIRQFQMKYLFLLALVCIVARAGDLPPEPQIDVGPFEPPADAFFRSNDKFAQPKQVARYQMLWPFEKRRAESSQIGDVVVLVEITVGGFPKKLAILSSTEPLFSRSALAALQKTRWEDLGRDTWFYFRAHFDLGEALDRTQK
jgi:hypothetical protein